MVFRTTATENPLSFSKGHSAVTIVSTIAKWGTIAAASGPLAPFTAIAGAVLTIFSLFGGSSGPSAEQQIMEQINKLSEHMDARFDRVEGMLERIHQQMHARFDRIEKVIHSYALIC